MGFSVMLWGAEKLVPAEYWCPYGTCITCTCRIINLTLCAYMYVQYTFLLISVGQSDSLGQD